MIFRTRVSVARALPEYKQLPGMALCDTVRYTFGINAGDTEQSVRIAVRAAENAVDRDGGFIGGVVIEVQSICVPDEQFSMDQDYFIQPIRCPGIFYVTGVTYSRVPVAQIGSAAQEVEELRRRIAQNGLPAPSFVHPPLKKKAPRRVRIVCPVCEQWVEVDNTGLLYSFVDGLDQLSDEDEGVKEAHAAAEIAGPFISNHLWCLGGASDAGELLFLYEPDPRYGRLDESKRE